MKRFGWIATLLSVALLVVGCSSEKPEEPADQSSEIDIDIEMPGDVPPADMEQPADDEKADEKADEAPAEMAPKADEPAAPAKADEPAKAEPAPAEAKPADGAKSGKLGVHKAMANALRKAVTGSGG